MKKLKMHSETTTDVSIVHENLSKRKANKENVVLIKTEALNPSQPVVPRISLIQFRSKYFHSFFFFFIFSRLAQISID